MKLAGYKPYLPSHPKVFSTEKSAPPPPPSISSFSSSSSLNSTPLLSFSVSNSPAFNISSCGELCVKSGNSFVEKYSSNIKHAINCITLDGTSTLGNVRIETNEKRDLVIYISTMMGDSLQGKNYSLEKQDVFYFTLKHDDCSKIMSRYDYTCFADLKIDLQKVES